MTPRQNSPADRRSVADPARCFYVFERFVAQPRDARARRFAGFWKKITRANQVQVQPHRLNMIFSGKSPGRLGYGACMGREL